MNRAVSRFGWKILASLWIAMEFGLLPTIPSANRLSAADPKAADSVEERGDIGTADLVRQIGDWQLARIHHSEHPIEAIACSPSGNLIAWTSAGRPVSTLRIAAGKTKPLDSLADKTVDDLVERLDANEFAVRQDAFRQLRDFGARLRPMLDARIDQAESRETLARLHRLKFELTPQSTDVHRGEVMAIAVSRDDSIVVTGGKDGTLRFWGVGREKPFHVARADREAIRAVACSPTQDLVASGGDGGICLWHTATGRLLAKWTGHKSAVHGLAFSSSGRQLASAGSFDHHVIVWDVTDTDAIAPQHTLRHDSEPLCVAFRKSPGELLVGGYGGLLARWKLHDSQAIWQRDAEQSRIFRAVLGDQQEHWLALSDDGKAIVCPQADSSNGVMFDFERALFARGGGTGDQNRDFFFATRSGDIWNLSPRFGEKP